MTRAGSSWRLRSRLQLSDEVAAYVRELVITGRVGPGEFLRLDQLAADLGVSVTPVREALAVLRGEDMVELEPGRGYVVLPVSREDLVDLFEVQVQLAGEVAARAAVRATGEVLDELDAAQEALSAALRAVDTAEVERWEYEFHRVLNRSAGARKLAWLLRSVARYLQHFYSSAPGWQQNVRRDHAAILEALRSGDAGAARTVMELHVIEGGRGAGLCRRDRAG